MPSKHTFLLFFHKDGLGLWRLKTSLFAWFFYPFFGTLDTGWNPHKIGLCEHILRANFGVEKFGQFRRHRLGLIWGIKLFTMPAKKDTLKLSDFRVCLRCKAEGTHTVLWYFNGLITQQIRQTRESRRVWNPGKSKNMLGILIHPMGYGY